MRDRHPRRAAIERDLARLADGTLDSSRSAYVEQLVASSSELQARLAEQRRAVAATRAVAELERAPLTLRLPARALASPPRRGPALGAGLAVAAGALVWLLAAVGGSPAGLTMAQAATVATRPATFAVAEPPHGQDTIPELRAAGLPFPYWEDDFDWHATGARSDRMGGRTLTTVFYRRGRQSIAYTIVSGEPMGAAAQDTISTFAMGQRHVVTWLRRGHTCVLSGRGVPFAAMMKLAHWRDHGRIPS